MAITFLESGTDATGDLSFFTSTSGTVASATDQAHTGPRSIKFSTGAGPTTASAQRTGVVADAGRRISCWFRFDTLPAADNARIIALLDAGSAVRVVMNIDTSGVTGITIAGVSNKNGTIVLAVNTWYRLTFSYTITDVNVFEFRTYINGVLDCTQTAGGPLGAATLTICQLALTTTWGANVNSWFDDFYIDDGADYTDPGNISVTAKKPAVENTTNFDTAIGNARGASDFNNVNEVPLSLTNGWQQSLLADTQENYGLQTAALGDVNIAGGAILGRTAWIFAKGSLGGLGTPQIMDNGTESAIVLTNVGKLFTVTTTSNTYPSNAAGIGMRATNSSDDTFLYECGTIIAYLSGAGSSGLTLMGVQ